MKTLTMILFAVLAVAVARGQEYGPFDLGTAGGSVTFEVPTSDGTLLVSANSSGGGTGGRNYAFSEARNGSRISGWGNERIAFSGVGDSTLVAVYYWWISLSEDGSWGYYDELKVYLRLVAPPPANRAPSISWGAAPTGVASGAGYFVAARGHDEDGNLTQVNVWKDGVPFAFGDGGNGSDRESGKWTSDGGPRNVTFTAQAVDADGALSPVISAVVTIDAPPIVNHTLTANAGAGGSALGGGTYPDGSTVTVTAMPDSSHVFSNWSGDAGGSNNPCVLTLDRDMTVIANFALRTFQVNASAGIGGNASGGGTFPIGSAAVLTAIPDGQHVFAGWSGDVSGVSNPLSVTVTRDLWVTANFNLKQFWLVTGTAGGGSVTAGGSYPVGAIVTLAATPDPTHWFSGWSGDASGNANPLGVVVDRAKSIQAVFTAKASQTISINPFGKLAPGAVVTVVASSSSGLAVTLSVVDGPGRLDGNLLTVTGPGTVILEANQAGDAFTLAAVPVRLSAIVATSGVVRVQRTARTLLGSESHFLIGNP